MEDRSLPSLKTYYPQVGGEKRKQPSSATPPPERLSADIFPNFTLQNVLKTSSHASPTLVWVGKEASAYDHRMDWSDEDDRESLIFKLHLEIIPEVYAMEPPKNFITIQATKQLDSYMEQIYRLNYEIEVYKKIRNCASLQRNSVQYVTDEIVYDPAAAAIIIEEMKKMGNKSFLVDRWWHKYLTKVKALVTLNVENSMSLHQFLMTRPILDQDLRPVLFQLLWGIQKLQEIGVQHNDMHAGNVLIAENWPSTDRDYYASVNTEPTRFNRLYYTYFSSAPYVTNVAFRLPLRSFRVVFFDWDLSDRAAPNQNQILIKNEFYCEKAGMCGMNARAEIYKGVYNLQYYPSVPPDAQKFLESICKLGSVDESVHGYPCYQDPRKPKAKLPEDFICTPYPPGEPKAIRTTQDLFSDPYFKDFLVQ